VPGYVVKYCHNSVVWTVQLHLDLVHCKSTGMTCRCSASVTSSWTAYRYVNFAVIIRIDFLAWLHLIESILLFWLNRYALKNTPVTWTCMPLSSSDAIFSCWRRHSRIAAAELVSGVLAAASFCYRRFITNHGKTVRHHLRCNFARLCPWCNKFNNRFLLCCLLYIAVNTRRSCNKSFLCETSFRQINWLIDWRLVRKRTDGRTGDSIMSSY